MSATGHDVTTKVFWLSFCDAARPAGQQFLGVTLVEVTAHEAEVMATELRDRFPLALAGNEWIAAALRKAHRLGCNPGGEVASMEVDTGSRHLSYFPRGVLMDRATCERIGAECLAREVGDVCQ